MCVDFFFNLSIIRGSEKEGYPFIKPFHLDFIACAAYDLSKKTRDAPEDYKKYLSNTQAKIRTILRLGIQTGHNAIVLGAFGCGAFKNDPCKIAKIFKSVISEEEFQEHYKQITFAIIDSNSGHNYSTFKAKLGSMTINNPL